MSDSVSNLCTLDCLDTGLKVAAVCSTGFFAGGSAYIAYAFEPGVMSISNHCALIAMRAALPRCKPLPLSILVGSLASAGTYALSVHNDKKDISWLIGSGILAAVIPYTCAFIGPINSRILKEELADDDAPKELGNWMFHHIVRTTAVFGLFAFYTYKLAK